MGTNTFNMKDLSDSVSDSFNLPDRTGDQITRFVFEQIKLALIQGKQVRLHKFGTFDARTRAAFYARNPANGARVLVPARRVVKLTVSDSLKKQVAPVPAK